MASLESMLYSGGDERLHFDERTNFNKYMCTRQPNNISAFGSSTASTISPISYEAAKALKAEIENDLQRNGEEEAYDRCLGRQTDKLRTVCRLGREIDVALYPSGTDCFRAAIGMFRSYLNEPISVVIVAPSETGGGVYAVVSQVSQTGGRVVAVDARQADGRAKPSETVDANVKAAVTEILRRRGHAILVLTDVSKSGLLVPSLRTAQEINERWPGRVSIVVDACQMRLSTATLRAYLARGWPTIITGSKFWAGPPFSGALLTPHNGVSVEWGAGRPREPTVNFGMLLRWEAALAEADRFLSLPSTDVRQFIELFGAVIQARKSERPSILDVDVPVLDRSDMVPTGAWDELQTLFPIGLCSDGRRLSQGELSAIYRSLAHDGELEVSRGMRFHLGQPVCVGGDKESSRWALRFSLSGRLAADALAAPKAQDAILDQLTEALDRLSWMAGRAPSLSSATM